MTTTTIVQLEKHIEHMIRAHIAECRRRAAAATLAPIVGAASPDLSRPVELLKRVDQLRFELCDPFLRYHRLKPTPEWVPRLIVAVQLSARNCRRGVSRRVKQFRGNQLRPLVGRAFAGEG